MYSDVFLSYQPADAGIAEQIAGQLERRGLRVFLDRMWLMAGVGADTATLAEFREAGSVLVLLSAYSRLGEWIDPERQDALAGKQSIVSVLLDEYARENALWPLLADRLAVTRHPNTDIDELIRQILQALNRSRTSVQGSWDSLEESLSRFSEDFLEDRAQPPQQQREMLDP